MYLFWNHNANKIHICRKKTCHTLIRFSLDKLISLSILMMSRAHFLCYIPWREFYVCFIRWIFLAWRLSCELPELEQRGTVGRDELLPGRVRGDVHWQRQVERRHMLHAAPIRLQENCSYVSHNERTAHMCNTKKELFVYIAHRELLICIAQRENCL